MARLAFRCGHTYGVDERLLKYCFLGSSNRFSTYTIHVRSDNGDPHDVLSDSH